MQKENWAGLVKLIEDHFKTERRFNRGLIVNDEDYSTQREAFLNELETFQLFGRRYALKWDDKDRHHFNYNGFGTKREHEGFKQRRKAFHSFLNTVWEEGRDFGIALAQLEELAKHKKEWGEADKEEKKLSPAKKKAIKDMCHIIGNAMSVDVDNTEVLFKKDTNGYYAHFIMGEKNRLNFYDICASQNFFDMVNCIVHEFKHALIHQLYVETVSRPAKQKLEFDSEVDLVKLLAAIEQDRFYSEDGNKYEGQLCEQWAYGFVAGAILEFQGAFTSKHVNGLISRMRSKEERSLAPVAKNYFPQRPSSYYKFKPYSSQVGPKHDTTWQRKVMSVQGENDSRIMG